MPLILTRPPDLPQPFEDKKLKPFRRAAFIGLAVSALLALFAAVYVPEGKTEEEYLEVLIEKKEAGEFLASGEEKDYCLLMAALKDSIVLDCLPVLEGINWERPPKSPEALGPDWVEITHPEQKKNGNRSEFCHKKHPKIKIVFDKGVPDAPGKGLKAYIKQDHWHRFNPNAKGTQDLYLDKSSFPVPDKSKDSHILIINR